MAATSQPDRDRHPGHPADLVDALILALKQMSRAGCRGFDCPETARSIMDRWGVMPAPEAVRQKPANTADIKESLTDIRADLGDCRRCRLCDRRRKIVFGQGAARARLVFVGEGPGREEDRQGLAFVGAAGQLLTKIIAAIKMTRDNVYICNIIKCRPPENRNPLPDEIEACLPFLKRQLKAIQPEYICALGSFAARTLLETKTSISRLRGRFHDYGGIQLLPTYHPAYLLRNPERKRDVWNDMQLLMRSMGIPH